MKKLLATLIAASIYGCTASAPATANVGEFFFFPKVPGQIQEFADENGTYESALSMTCDIEQQVNDNCLGIVFNGDYWMIDAARNDDNILNSNDVRFSINGEPVDLKYIRVDSAIVIHRDENPTFNPVGKVFTITTSLGKGVFSI